MSEIPAPATVIAAAKRIAADFESKIPGITAVRPSVVQGRPVVAVIAIIPQPRSFPKALNVRLPSGGVYPLPIIWQQVQSEFGVAKGYFGTGPRGKASTPLPAPATDRPIDDAMWGGAPPVTDRPGTLISPNPTPQVGIVEEIPTTEENRFQLSISARLPQFVTPNYWSIPFDENGDVCVDFYERWYTAFTYVVPSDRMVIVTGISYQFNDTLIPFDIFEVNVFRDGQSLSEFEDMRALNTADPAEEYVFAGHYRPLPFYGRFDHDQRIVVRVRVRGQYPFIHIPTDPLGGCFQVFLTGWMASLYDTRDGGARPVDMGDLNQLSLGEQEV
jgi:hypothetical protein